MRRALICGISGQDGSFLAEFLLSKGYEVHGIVRQSSIPRLDNIQHLIDEKKITLYFGDITDQSFMLRTFMKVMPDEMYNLAAQSFVGNSFETPAYTFEVNAAAVINMLEIIRCWKPDTHFYQASTSEMFGVSDLGGLNEGSKFIPHSPYAISKLAAHWMVRNYCKAYNLFAVDGILFNHESQRRGVEFVTRKITKGIAEILAHKREKISLGDLRPKRDWGFAPDYVEAMWKMTSGEFGDPASWVIGTGNAISVGHFLDKAFGYVGLDYRKFVSHNEKNLRPIDVWNLQADYSMAWKLLAWKPKAYWDSLIKMMIDADLERCGLQCPGEGKNWFMKNYSPVYRWL